MSNQEKQTKNLSQAQSCEIEGNGRKDNGGGGGSSGAFDGESEKGKIEEATPARIKGNMTNYCV